METKENKKIIRLQITDRMNDEEIILNANGHFPKRIIIIESRGKKEYLFRKTRNGGYILN